jgi:uncharacterized membrane protein YbhN (UPF0104 family)
MLRRLISWSQPIFLGLAIVAIGWFLVSQWPTLRTYPWRLDWGWLLTALLLTWASWGVEIVIWRQLLASLGGRLSYWAACRVWFLSAIVRYIPGNIWQPLSLTLYARRHGVAPEATITSLLIFQVVSILAVAPILIVYFTWIDTNSLAAQFVGQFNPALLWLVLLPLLAFLLRPQWLIQLLNWGLMRINRPPLDVRLTSGTLLMLIVVTLFNWLMWGAVFAAFAFAVAGESLGLTPEAIAPALIASFPIASIIGFLSLISPSGVGVREGAFYLMLTPQIAGGVVAVIALGIRVWAIINELLLAAISAPFERSWLANSSAGGSLASEQALPEPVVAPDLRREIL